MIPTTLLLLVALLPAAVCHPVDESVSPKPGVLIVAGGGVLPADLHPRALELAGGNDANILIIPWASRREDAGSATVAVWKEAGATTVTVIPEEAAAARSAIESADLIWFGGGSQSRLMDALRERDLIEVVKMGHRQGTIIAGTSAGAAVMSPYMMTGKAELEALIKSSTELVEGLGLWPGVIVDQHFLARRRWARLFTAVADHPDQIGIGIDEQTAIVVDPDGSWQVIGRGPVVVIDGRGKIAESLQPELPAKVVMYDLTVHFVGKGQVWKPTATTATDPDH
jgi:cyanophycinase